MDKASESYLRFELDEDEAYIRKDSVNLLGNVDAAIFDCDGVLIDIRDSYNRAISETVAYILGRFTGCAFPKDVITDEIIFLFRKSGGFNNDWDACYGILMFMLCHLPREFQEIYRIHAKDIDVKEKPLRRLLLIESVVREKDIQWILSRNIVNKLVEELKVFTDSLDESGVLSVDKNLLKNLPISMKDCYEELKRLLFIPYKVGGGIIPSVFEEIFCGSILINDVYGVEPAFRTRRGLIENERIILRIETLNQLSSIFGKPNFGIASGSRLKSAKYVLGDVLSYFNADASVFLDDVEREEERILKSTGKAVNLKKPNGFSLRRAAEGLMPFRAILCVGDSLEDTLMAKEVKKEDPRFMFAGVYQHSGLKDALLNSFLKAEADVILPSVNEIPLVLEELKGEMKT